MPALTPTDFYATITWLGHNADRAIALASEPIDEMPLSYAGFARESHAGLTCRSDSRVLQQYPRGTEIRNVRQLSILSVEDIVAIASDMQLETLNPAWLGASLVVEGIPAFSHIPPSSRLQGTSGTTLTVNMENRPCTLTAKVIDAAQPGYGKGFKPAALNRRGVTAWVEREGTLRLGEILRLHIPDQPAWPHLQAARGI